MKKLFIALSALLLTHVAVANRHSSHLFVPYKVTIANRSGGIAQVKFEKGIQSSMRRIENGKDITVTVRCNEARAKFVAGPEENKSTYTVQFCAPTAAGKMLVLNAKGYGAQGFETKCNPINVLVVNKSGGLATVQASKDTSLKTGTKIAEDKSVTAKVLPGAAMVVHAGPEGKKHDTEITFGHKTGIVTPEVTLLRVGVMTGSATARGVIITTKNAEPTRRRHNKPHYGRVSHSENLMKNKHKSRCN